MTPGLRAVLLGGYCQEARALFAAMTTQPDSAHKRAINTFIVGLKNAGLWDTIGYMCGWGALNAAQSFRINWKNAAQVGTAINSPAFAVDSGYTFDGATNYIDTLYAAGSGGGGIGNTSVTIGVYERTNVATNTLAAGAQAVSSRRVSIMPRSAGSIMRAAMSSALLTGVAAISDSRGLSVGTQRGGVFELYKNGVLIDTPSGTAATLPPQTVYLGGENLAGSYSGGRAAQEAGLLVASGWTAQQNATFYTLAQACMTAIGANV